MRKLLILILINVIFISYQSNIFAQKALKKDNSEIIVNKVPFKKIEQFKNNNDFKYSKVDKGINLWDKIIFFLFRLIEKIFSNKGAAPYIRYIIIAILVVFAIFKLLGYKFTGLFVQDRIIKDKKGLNFKLQDISSIDFELEIKEAADNKNYRLAVRFQYLKLLNLLNNKKIINWQINKTNLQYLEEMNKNENFDEFKNLSNIFEYSWYGDFQIEKSRFLQWQNKFASIYDKIKN
ncbi:MAG: hypothetical protein JXR51_11345 [Bacteroidales bacterium]|nr:hypothetical protein [Bacteroidales bacterium]MBN2757764.1 hypothetical protein [Bacteroidales bacterium]